MKGDNDRQADYNDEPVHFCTHCNSLSIKVLDGTDIDFCADCGNTDISVCHINDWLAKKEAIDKNKSYSIDLDILINDIKSNK